MPSVKPIAGKPGHFMDSSGQVIVLTETRETDRYDTEQQASGAITAGAILRFFRNLNNKNDLDANIPEAGKLVTGSERMILERLGVTIQASNSTLMLTVADLKRVMCAGYLEFRLNKNVIDDGPLEKFPSGYGVSGSTTETSQAVANVGVPSTAGVRNLKEQQIVTDAHTVAASITFQARTWLTTSTMPTLDNQTAVRLYAHGLLESAATNN